MRTTLTVATCCCLAFISASAAQQLAIGLPPSAPSVEDCRRYQAKANATVQNAYTIQASCLRGPTDFGHKRSCGDFGITAFARCEPYAEQICVLSADRDRKVGDCFARARSPQPKDNARRKSWESLAKTGSDLIELFKRATEFATNPKKYLRKAVERRWHDEVFGDVGETSSDSLTLGEEQIFDAAFDLARLGAKPVSSKFASSVQQNALAMIEGQFRGSLMALNRVETSMNEYVGDLHRVQQRAFRRQLCHDKLFIVHRRPTRGRDMTVAFFRTPTQAGRSRGATKCFGLNWSRDAEGRPPRHLDPPQLPQLRVQKATLYQAISPASAVETTTIINHSDPAAYLTASDRCKETGCCGGRHPKPN